MRLAQLAARGTSRNSLSKCSLQLYLIKGRSYLWPATYYVQGALSSALSADQGLDHSAGTKSRISGVNVNVCMCVVFANGFNNPSDTVSTNDQLQTTSTTLAVVGRDTAVPHNTTCILHT